MATCTIVQVGSAGRDEETWCSAYLKKGMYGGLRNARALEYGSEWKRGTHDVVFASVKVFVPSPPSPQCIGSLSFGIGIEDALNDSLEIIRIDGLRLYVAV